jgi:2-polyprenyl-3-methyl-5-hydroxy-6-metoxy-1,4-benzoquinol methylase
MSGALRLLADALTLRTPPRALLWGLLNKLNYLSRTGDRRYEFERLYLADPDPWNYRTSDYEDAKYRRVRDRAIAWRRASGAALEVGCSIGVFTRMLADCFEEVTAVDLSQEAINVARAHNLDAANLTFLRQDVRRLNLGRTFDVLFCAEVLYYLPRRAGPRVCDALDRHLTRDGVIVLVSGVLPGEESFLHFDDWKSLLRTRFAELFSEVVEDPTRPYEITIFARSERFG